MIFRIFTLAFFSWKFAFVYRVFVFFVFVYLCFMFHLCILRVEKPKLVASGADAAVVGHFLPLVV